MNIDNQYFLCCFCFRPDGQPLSKKALKKIEKEKEKEKKKADREAKQVSKTLEFQLMNSFDFKLRLKNASIKNLPPK